VGRGYHLSTSQGVSYFCRQKRFWRKFWFDWTCVPRVSWQNFVSGETRDAPIICLHWTSSVVAVSFLPSRLFCEMSCDETISHLAAQRRHTQTPGQYPSRDKQPAGDMEFRLTQPSHRQERATTTAAELFAKGRTDGQVGSPWGSTFLPWLHTVTHVRRQGLDTAAEQTQSERAELR
jgi:hypothetical protein